MNITYTLTIFCSTQIFSNTISKLFEEFLLKNILISLHPACLHLNNVVVGLFLIQFWSLFVTEPECFDCILYWVMMRLFVVFRRGCRTWSCCSSWRWRSSWRTWSTCRAPWWRPWRRGWCRVRHQKRELRHHKQLSQGTPLTRWLPENILKY